ncbi:MAG TPA: A24 family peptidase [Planctomycetota bacterium]|nr:A24 family peptidase [Planctomycetota bacterium]
MFILIMLAAAAYDLRQRRIPNYLIAATVILAFGMHGMVGGLDGLASTWLLGLMAGAGLLILPFAMGGMGAGDVKLLACAGSMLGPVQVFYAFLAAAVLGGLMAVGKAAAHKSPGQGPGGAGRIPYGLPLAAGVLLSAAGAWL